ncbi:hypothetical protein [Actinoplanes xinjiangensis]|uniref:Uncharacterized protein n=1 Tax=Actinoplanes xinjiangensis TaxID=512350 RepID=A0A316EL79_9ACTN|nr:hypothetical protein [Actinoplanes xinjiangensis]PWK33232.1 hypothetical protein BC793_12822 [Actinoplanes xinjiangensis]GIF43529.1 hypothetical protein Axi01nite_78400 [Actinoplanes xinjiangensis]
MTSTAGDRKRAELAAKTAALRDEFAHWRAESAAGKPLEKHHTQIHRITARLGVLLELLTAEPAAGDLLDHWQSIETSLLDVHHLWDFFRTKFASRYPPWLRDILIVGDELVWSCYEPAQRAAVQANQIEPEAVREPPLTFFSTDAGPVALARHAVYRVRGRGSELHTQEFAGELQALPVPVTAVPWHQAGHLPDVLMLAHESGHHVQDDFRLTAVLTAAVAAGLSAAGTPQWRQDFWVARFDEIFADVYGVLAVGAAYVAALIDFLAAPAATIAMLAADRRYPPPHLRVQIALAALRATCPADPRGPALTGAWWDAHPEHDYQEYDADVTPLVDAILAEPLPVFGSVPLPGVLSFGQWWREAEVDNARMIARRKPDSGNPRALLAAAALAFHDDPATYGDVGVAALARARVLAVQAQGTRFRSQARVQPQLAAADRAAAEALHRRLSERRRQPG